MFIDKVNKWANNEFINQETTTNISQIDSTSTRTSREIFLDGKCDKNYIIKCP